MYRISDQQIDYILSDIGARGVEMESLQQNLLDHVCCIIENNLEENGDFENFYKKTIQTFYKDELWEIEEETLLLLTYKNYYTMKKIMINSGIAAATFFIIGSFFKFMHWPGASMLIILGMAIGVLVYLPLLFLFKKNETTESRAKLVLAIGTINGILFCLNALFKVMHWPGANAMWFMTLGLFALVFIPLYFFNGIRDQANKINTITTTLILIILAGVFFLQTSLRPSFTVQKKTIQSDQHMEDSYHYATEQNKISYNLSVDSSNNKASQEKLKLTCNALCEKIEKMKLNFIQQMEGDSSIREINYQDLENSGLSTNYDFPTRMLFTENGDAKDNLKNLKEDLINFNSYISSTYEQNSAKLINLSSQKDEMGIDGSWEKIKFYHNPLLCVLRNLTQLQLDIRFIESSCIKHHCN
ncbi:MAG: hypothetical protein IPL10_11815 [Bacteroidetes bacterium]|nr:hypothetical protein [Bacteroidota bacterium]